MTTERLGRAAAGEKLARAIEHLDHAQSENPRKRSECKHHEFILRDRCFWCGAPMTERASRR